jgi:catechol 2,3-dioxygenase-like lactoylglutathione lyase family enzyme
MSLLGKLSHIALAVRDPERTGTLFSELFDAALVQRRHGAESQVSVELGETWFVLVRAEVQPLPSHDHVAFRVSSPTVTTVARRLAARGHAYQLARSGTSLYFRDFDNHLFELDASGVALD